MRSLAALAATLALASCNGGVAYAHDTWANGTVVPPWIKSACCGPRDVHRLTLSQVREDADGWHVDGVRRPVARDHVLPSQDGEVWGFWSPDTPDPTVFCLFLPLSF